MSASKEQAEPRYYHGTRTQMRPGDRIEPSAPQPGDEAAQVRLTKDLDAAIWDAELAEGDGPPQVYIVAPTGPVEESPPSAAEDPPSHPTMRLHSSAALEVLAEVTDWTLYHGTRADLQVGDEIAPGHSPNFGDRSRTTPYVYFTRTLDAAIWGAELAAGGGPERIYVVETTGPFEDDPNVTNARFRGNPTKSFRSRAPLRVAGEVRNWQGHAPELLAAMKEGIAKLEQQGIEPIDD